MSAENRYPLWDGYRPTPGGKSQSYHVKKSRNDGSWAISCWIGDSEYFCAPESGSDTEAALTGAVRVGYHAGIQPGGTLTVNECKDVVKTAYLNHRSVSSEYLVGNHPDFHVVFIGVDGRCIDNADASGMEIGSLWPYQRVGTRYHYRPAENDIFMIHSNWDVKITISFKQYFDFDFQYILDQLEVAKGAEGGRFYVNEHGLMFAPTCEASGTMWRTVYAGRIDPSRWLSREMLRSNVNAVLAEQLMAA